jgi:hypothetical protein
MILLSMYKKILVSILLLAIVSTNLALPSMASAQSWWAPTYQEFNDKVNNDAVPANEIFGERYTHAQVWWVVYSLMSFAIEHNISECISDNPDSLDAFINCTTTADASNPNLAQARPSMGFLEFARMSDSMIRTKPASGVAYVASVMDHVGIQTAHAQQSGFGFNTLSPVLGLWGAARNAAYALMTFAVIILAFMIMFRTRISPQASVTVQVAIPRIIIGLLLITFSYAIAGFVIDLSYVVLGIIAAIFQASGVIDTGAANTVDTFNMVNDIGGGIFNFGMAVVFLVMRSFGSVGGAALTLGSFGAVPVAATILVLIIALILIIIAVVRIFWIFLRTYVVIIMHVVALPFAALGYVASPSGNMFMQLLRSLIGNVSVFVSIALTVMVAHVLLWGMSGAGLDLVSIGNVYHVGALGGSGVVSLPGFNGVDAATVGLFVGIVVLLMGPSIANNIKSLIITGQMSRERGGMIGAGAAGLVGGFAAANVRQGVMGEIGYKAADMGYRMQTRENATGWQRAMGRGLVSFGAPHAQIGTHRGTGAITGVTRKGEAVGGEDEA